MRRRATAPRDRVRRPRRATAGACTSTAAAAFTSAAPAVFPAATTPSSTASTVFPAVSAAAVPAPPETPRSGTPGDANDPDSSRRFVGGRGASGPGGATGRTSAAGPGNRPGPAASTTVARTPPGPGAGVPERARADLRRVCRPGVRLAVTEPCIAAAGLFAGGPRAVRAGARVREQAAPGGGHARPGSAPGRPPRRRGAPPLRRPPRKPKRRGTAPARPLRPGSRAGRGAVPRSGFGHTRVPGRGRGRESAFRQREKPATLTAEAWLTYRDRSVVMSTGLCHSGAPSHDSSGTRAERRALDAAAVAPTTAPLSPLPEPVPKSCAAPLRSRPRTGGVIKSIAGTGELSLFLSRSRRKHGHVAAIRASAAGRIRSIHGGSAHATNRSRRR